ncbi:MAG: hypothetical protein J7M26_07985, partial [Armatimonadetes bacterium]|nr:hypothetical protein [Armatimonadota bacterium]
PEYVEPRAVGDDAVLLRGVCPTQAERTRLAALAKQIAGQDVQVIDMLLVEGEDVPAAERAAEYLRNLYGSSYEYVVWGEKTVIVRGNLTPQTTLELQTLDEALGDEIHITSVTTGRPVTTPPVAEIQKAVGPSYKVWLLGTGNVVVEGEAKTQAELDRTEALLKAYSDRAQIINLVRLAPKPKPTMDEFVGKLREALADESLAVRPIGPDSVAVEGTVPTKEAAKRVEDLLGAVEQPYKVVNLVRMVTPEKRRVLIHVRVVDIDRDKLKRYGVDWGQIVDGNFVDQPWLVKVEGGVDNVYTLGVDLHALETQNYAKILAAPNLVVNDGEEASMLVGGEIPIPIANSGAAGFNTVTIEYKEYGVNLKVKPEITEQGMIRTTVSPEVSSLDYSNGVTVSGFTIPGLKTRRASSVVTVKPGSTLIIGGLIRNDESKLVRKIPLLGDLPIIGELFKRTEFKEGKTELVIFLTPEILPPANAEGGGSK